MRINTRLDESHSKKLEYLKKITGEGVSEVIKRAIDEYYRQTKEAQNEAVILLKKTGFIGCSGGSPELSTNYKKEFRKELDRKHGHR